MTEEYRSAFMILLEFGFTLIDRLYETGRLGSDSEESRKEVLAFGFIIILKALRWKRNRLESKVSKDVYQGIINTLWHYLRLRVDDLDCQAIIDGYLELPRESDRISPILLAHAKRQGWEAEAVLRDHMIIRSFADMIRSGPEWRH